MLAVFAPLERVQELLRQEALDVVVANKNAPRQCVLSGPIAEIERARQILSDGKVSTHPVPVSAAFHSRFVAHAREPFQQFLNSITPRDSTIPVFSNGTAEPYPQGAEQVRALLASQLARPVEFVAQIEGMYRAGARTFLEVGPDAKLTGLVHAILDGREHQALASDASRGRSGNLYDLGCSLATLAALGYAVDLTRWDEGAPGRSTAEKKAGLTVKICGANVRPKERPEAEPRTQPRLTNGEPTGSSEHTAVPRPPRFSLARDKNLAISTHPQPRHHSEIDRTMNLPERINSHHTNGQAASHHPRDRFECGRRKP